MRQRVQFLPDCRLAVDSEVGNELAPIAFGVSSNGCWPQPPQAVKEPGVIFWNPFFLLESVSEENESISKFVLCIETAYAGLGSFRIAAVAHASVWEYRPSCNIARAAAPLQLRYQIDRVHKGGGGGARWSWLVGGRSTNLRREEGSAFILHERKYGFKCCCLSTLRLTNSHRHLSPSRI